MFDLFFLVMQMFCYTRQFVKYFSVRYMCFLYYTIVSNAESTHKMINLCESYTDQYLIKLIGYKCQAVVFYKCSSSQVLCFHVNNHDIQVVSCIKDIIYLGCFIKWESSDPLVLLTVSAFNKRFNAFIGDFDCVASEVNSHLPNSFVQTTCMVWYLINFTTVILIAYVLLGEKLWGIYIQCPVEPIESICL